MSANTEAFSTKGNSIPPKQTCLNLWKSQFLFLGRSNLAITV